MDGEQQRKFIRKNWKSYPYKVFHSHDKQEESVMGKMRIVHIAKKDEKYEKTFNFSSFCGTINYIKGKQI